mgnify:CR=1 FL=1
MGAPAGTVVVEGGHYFDPTGIMRPFAAIVLQDDRIQAIVPPGEAWTAPPSAERVDARGRFIIPGLIDGHAHMDREQWLAAWESAYARFCGQVDRGIDTVIDPYASEQPAEFFAVLSEAFFTLPRAVRSTYPDLYAQLALFYRQDPAARLPE